MGEPQSGDDEITPGTGFESRDQLDAEVRHAICHGEPTTSVHSSMYSHSTKY